jgi:hypothetical protein
MLSCASSAQRRVSSKLTAGVVHRVVQRQQSRHWPKSCVEAAVAHARSLSNACLPCPPQSSSTTMSSGGLARACASAQTACRLLLAHAACHHALRSTVRLSECQAECVCRATCARCRSGPAHYGRTCVPALRSGSRRCPTFRRRCAQSTPPAHTACALCRLHSYGPSVALAQVAFGS